MHKNGLFFECLNTISKRATSVKQKNSAVLALSSNPFISIILLQLLALQFEAFQRGELQVCVLAYSVVVLTFVQPH